MSALGFLDAPMQFDILRVWQLIELDFLRAMHQCLVIEKFSAADDVQSQWEIVKGVFSYLEMLMRHSNLDEFFNSLPMSHPDSVARMGLEDEMFAEAKNNLIEMVRYNRLIFLAQPHERNSLDEAYLRQRLEPRLNSLRPAMNAISSGKWDDNGPKLPCRRQLKELCANLRANSTCSIQLSEHTGARAKAMLSTIYTAAFFTLKNYSWRFNPLYLELAFPAPGESNWGIYQTYSIDSIRRDLVYLFDGEAARGLYDAGIRESTKTKLSKGAAGDPRLQQQEGKTQAVKQAAGSSLPPPPLRTLQSKPDHYPRTGAGGPIGVPATEPAATFDAPGPAALPSQPRSQTLEPVEPRSFLSPALPSGHAQFGLLPPPSEILLGPGPLPFPSELLARQARGAAQVPAPGAGFADSGHSGPSARPGSGGYSGSPHPESLPYPSMYFSRDFAHGNGPAQPNYNVQMWDVTGAVLTYVPTLDVSRQQHQQHQQHAGSEHSGREFGHYPPVTGSESGEVAAVLTSPQGHAPVIAWPVLPPTSGPQQYWQSGDGHGHQ